MSEINKIPDWAIIPNDKLLERAEIESNTAKYRAVGGSEGLFTHYLLRQLKERIEELEAELKDVNGKIVLIKQYYELNKGFLINPNTLIRELEALLNICKRGLNGKI